MEGRHDPRAKAIEDFWDWFIPICRHRLQYCDDCGALLGDCRCPRLVNITTATMPPVDEWGRCDREDHAPDCECETLTKPREE